ncbi:MAG TPA: sigma-70 family RNA polymerase sigma factor [Xanthobacteraceae bacterium]|nr:sigma-70 family RNA polymerase sigma factor [Xanthobacteraceae bacterium]
MSSPERLQDLLDAVAEGDRDALHRLYVLSAPRLYGVTLRILREPALAQDALVRAYARIWQAAGSFDPRIAELDRWMVAIARQAALQVARGRSELTFDRTASERDEAAEPAAPGTISADLRTLLNCLAELSGDLRRMILLAYYDGWSREALAVEFDAPAATIRTWLLRSLEQLRQCTPR